MVFFILYHVRFFTILSFIKTFPATLEDMLKKVLVFVFLLGAFQVVQAQDEIESFSESDLEVAPFADETHAETTIPLESETPTYDAQASGEVILEKPRDYTLSYGERRSTWGITFSMNYEQFYPMNYFSLIKNDYYENYHDVAIPLLGGEFGVKYNFSLGSVAVLFGYAQGTIADDGQGLEITTAITKAALNLTLDNLFSEPYVAPYAQIGAHTIDWSESETLGGVTRDESFTSEINYHYKAGLLFQLNWIERKLDPNSQEEALRSSGLENTYIDIFYTSYAQPQTISTAQGMPGEGNLQSDAYGVGLKLEF